MKSGLLENIQKEIQTGILTNQGKSFTFTYNVTTVVRYYQRSKLFPKLYRQKDTIRYRNIFTLKLVLGKLPSSITTEYKKCLFNELGEGPWINGYTSVSKGYRVTFHVPEEYASEQYKKYAKTALPFRDKLLSTHKDLLNTILFSKFHDELYHSFLNRCFYVTPTGVGDYSKLGVDTISIYFSGYGMRNLKDISECYGFALAAIEILRSKWEQHGTYKTEISIEGQSIRVENSFVEKEPTLHSW